MNAAKRNRILQRLRAQNPAPTTELKYRSPFELMIAVILSAQATDISVNKATRELFKVANTPEQIAELGVRRLKAFIRSIGLYNDKAKHIVATARMLIDQHDSRVPDTRQALQALPGVGRKTANVILNTAFNQPTIAVDTHIFRVANRTGLAPGKTPLAVEKQLFKAVPDEFKRHAHHWLILHGRYTCTARNPQCRRCVINDLCEYREKTAK